MNITQEMQDLISKNLPAATAGEMSKFIDEANALKISFDNLSTKHEVTRKEVQRLEDLNLEYVNEIQSRKEFDKEKKEHAVAVEKLRIDNSIIDLTITKIKLDESLSRNALTERLVEKVFGHPSVTVSTTETKQHVVESSPGYSSLVTGYDEVKNETTTQHKE